MTLISERIKPIVSTMDPRIAATGEPDFPKRFAWRDRDYELAEVIAKWHETGDCTHGSEEQYVRKHWFWIRTTDGTQMKIYFERRPASKRERTARWWLFSVGDAA